jgi:hypothetical protein
MRLAEKFRRRFEDALEAAGLEDVKVGQPCTFLSDHGLTFSGRIMNAELNYDEIYISVRVEGEERPRSIVFEEMLELEDDFPDRMQWVYWDPDQSKPKQTRRIPGQLTLDQ